MKFDEMEKDPRKEIIIYVLVCLGLTIIPLLLLDQSGISLPDTPIISIGIGCFIALVYFIVKANTKGFKEVKEELDKIPPLIG